MTRKNYIQCVEPQESFKKDYLGLDDQLRNEVDEAIKDLLRDPIPLKRRFEKLQGFRNPGIYTVHVTPNHSHKLSFELRGSVAVLRRISTHKVIDKTP